jgi:dolichyl-phosphate beta-glucosyltransferase
LPFISSTVGSAPANLLVPHQLSFLLVIPCFRESTRLRPFLSDLCQVLGDVGGVTILVVDDGSGEDEAGKLRALVDEYRRAHPFVRPVLTLPQNVGKGGTVYAGWSAHQGEQWLAFADADGAVSASEIARLVTAIRSARRELAPHAWFASRVKMLGRNVHRLFHRHLVGRVYATLVSELLHVPVYDTQCGCKVVPRNVFESVQDRLTLMGFAFDVDLMMALRHAGCDIIEFPVDWSEIPGGKIHLFRDSWRMFRDVYLLRRKWHPDPGSLYGVE